MAKVEVFVCDLDGKHLPVEPELGDRQGGPVEIVFPAYTQRFVLCADCMARLDEFRTLGERVLSGTLPLPEAFNYMPVVDD